MTAPLILDRYHVLKRLAVGGMGEIFLARQVVIADRLVILKSLLPELALQKSFVEEFLDEARICATLNHPNIVSLYDVGAWHGTYFIAMEYVHGENLGVLLGRSIERGVTLPAALAARIIRDAAAGLDYAHRAVGVDGQQLRIIHRDVSPQNIMVRNDGVAKVVDFGIARAAIRGTKTATGNIKGKLAYMAPEQLTDVPFDARADQYALAVVFWELLTQSRLFAAATDMAVMQKVVAGGVVAPSTVRPEIPRELDTICLRMIARNPDERYASLTDAITDIDEYLEAHPKTSSNNALGTWVEHVVGYELRARSTIGAGDLFNMLIQAPSPSNSEVATQPINAKAVPATRLPTTRRRRSTTFALAAAGLVALASVIAIARNAAPPPPVVAHESVSPAVSPVAAPEIIPAASATVPAAPPVAATSEQPKSTAPVPNKRAPSASKNAIVDKREPAQQRSSTGWLTLRTSPWSRVSIDGEPRGTTPLYKLALSAGEHIIVLQPESGAPRKERIVIVAGEETRSTIDLSR